MNLASARVSASVDACHRRTPRSAGLHGLGVTRGDCVAIWMNNSPPWVGLLFACARIGATVMAVNTRFRSAELGDILARSGAKVLVLAPCILSPVLDVSQLIDSIENNWVTHSHANHQIIRRLLDALIDNNDLSSLKAINCGSGMTGFHSMPAIPQICAAWSMFTMARAISSSA